MTLTLLRHSCSFRKRNQHNPTYKYIIITLSTDSNECDRERGVHYNEDCHECINEDPGYRCICDAGYKEDNAATEGNCIDINECLGKRGVNYSVGCHNCINTGGSYMCDCDEGYELHPDVKSCIDVDECDRRLYDTDNCHTCVNLIGGHTCLCNDTYTLDTNNNNETCIATIDPSKQSPTGSSVGIIIGMVFALFLLIAAAVAAACLIQKRRRAEKNAYTSAKVPDEEKMKPNEYEELRGLVTLSTTTFLTLRTSHQNPILISNLLRSFPLIFGPVFGLSLGETDIDECAGERGENYAEDCHTCVNTIGSYTCECDDGYELDSATNQTCI
ncbi:hypothetical protein CAPTEDRAFT_192856, partial [Capitella teleta]